MAGRVSHWSSVRKDENVHGDTRRPADLARPREPGYTFEFYPCLSAYLWYGDHAVWPRVAPTDRDPPGQRQSIRKQAADSRIRWRGHRSVPAGRHIRDRRHLAR